MRPSAHKDRIPSHSGLTGTPVTKRHSLRRRVATRIPALLLVVPLLAGLVGGPVAPVGADELSDAKAKQAALAQQLKNQKEAIAQINALQADLSSQIASTRQQLHGITADLATVRTNINGMVLKIRVVRQNYLALVAQLELLDTQLAHTKIQEMRARWHLQESKDLLAERLRQAYDTDRTSLLETFLSGGSFTDVLSEVSYSIDMGEQDKALAEQIGQDQEALAAVHQTVVDMRAATDDLRIQTAAQKVKLNQQLVELRAAQKELKRLEAETAKALEIQKEAYRKLAANKKNLSKAVAATAAAKKKLAARINAIVAAAYAQGNIPSQYNGTLSWPMNGSVTQEFGCTGFEWEPPLGSCPHFHQGIDIVADYGTPVHASGSGRIVYCGWNYADGADPAWIVIIAHSQQLETWYAHMTPNCPVPQGAAVRAGQTIGHEGNTGHSTGAHLHWAVRFNGEFVNPRLFL
jgi:murein DD-endopeptidase MepM/ murein hydrolase activator NlpD